MKMYYNEFPRPHLKQAVQSCSLNYTEDQNLLGKYKDDGQNKFRRWVFYRTRKD